MGSFKLVSSSLWDRDVQYLKNVGPRRVYLLKKMGVSTVGDLLYHFPRDYDNRSDFKPGGYVSGEKTTVRGVVAGLEEKRPRRGLTITRAFIHSGMERLVAVWFNQPFVRRQVTVGARILVTGKVNSFHNELQIQVADYEIEDGKEMINSGRIVPIYPLTGGISQRLIRLIIKSALDEWGHRLPEFIPSEMLARFVLPETGPALHAIHFPDSFNEIKMARRRFIFEEFFIHQLMVALMRKRSRVDKKNHVYPPGDDRERRLLSLLPFSLTPGQAGAWEEIKKDMARPFPMNRLLQGDVGSGKTVVCVLAMLRAVSGGFQAAFMAPTEILAEQHYLNIKGYFESLGVQVGLVTGGMKKKARKDLLIKIASGETGVVVGTHALIQEDVQFNKLALAVIDEQHRFGVRQRAMLRKKGQNPDVLVTTATPIPRTLAMTVYGDLDVSTISGLPPGRKPVKTFVCSKSQLGMVYREIKKEISLGRQGYIVCPLVEESEKVDLQAAVELKEYLSSGPLAGCAVEILHGRMKPEEKESVMGRFRDGAVDVLVSTTVIEVGVDIPNAAIMAVVDADRFGLAQLHQLRGRVGRGDSPARCYLISDSRGEEPVYRLEAMRTISDGFVLAEKDLELRGPGEMHGTRQSGDLLYRIADPVRDFRALETAAREARRLVDGDPELKKAENAALAREIKARFSGLGFLSIG
ncbi:MAG: ATP-dependent DNA helicase RecG [Actinobacteria bacterium]|nr:ATP-dependent DNA helicase RecG [Actinomycetota bacterium]